MYVETKYTSWNSIHVPKELEKEFILSLKTGKLQTVYDIYEFLAWPDEEELDDARESLSLKTNHNHPTIIVIEDNCAGTVWTNKDKINKLNNLKLI